MKSFFAKLKCLNILSKLSCLMPRKFRKNCNTSGCDSQKKCCPMMMCGMKFVAMILFLFIANTYLGFSNMAIDRYIQNHPRRIIDAVENMVKMERQKKTDDVKQKAGKISEKLIEDRSIPFLGNKNGDKVVVELFDYNCGYCRKAHGEILKSIAMDKELKFVLINTPVMSEASFVAAKAAEAVFKISSEHFAEFHNKIMSHPGQLTEQAVIAILKSVTQSRFSDVKKYMDSKENEEVIQKNYETMKEIGLQGTPAFIINKQLFPGFISADEIMKAFK